MKNSLGNCHSSLLSYDHAVTIFVTTTYSIDHEQLSSFDNLIFMSTVYFTLESCNCEDVSRSSKILRIKKDISFEFVDEAL